MPRRPATAATIAIRRQAACCPACRTWGWLPVAAWDGASVVWCPCCGPVTRIALDGWRLARAEELAAGLITRAAAELGLPGEPGGRHHHRP